ncbi:hypothetical protein QBC46DRAFT_390167 [Diplogelasinospora grovesii]|uniref:Uncharacterized protein n=1 Tax=Diplogelasinospora grovesii TaxID=303347 RepID=A0AAN6N583_9PEZI|nr:hypothetical protein QBC46DRAFT_390167 [Diplogelasinospora grovesii]
MYKHSHDLPLNGSDSLAKAMLTEWQATAAHLSSYVSSKSLELSLVCDIDCENEDVAKLAVAPLLFLSPLKNCHVRLCGKPNAQLQQVAEDAVLQARNISPSILSPLATALRLSSGSSSSSPSPSSLHRRHLLNLPRELRFCILNYTDLVAPRKEVTWSRQHSGYLPGKASCADRQGRGQKCPPAIHHGCQFSRCWDNAYSEYSSIGCFCRRRHASSSSACRCWAPPTALFLVCRTLCEDARVVFFSNNRFVVHEFQSHPPRAMPPLVGNDYSYERFAASQFLRDIVPADCLRELRFLELVFAPYSPQAWPRDGHAALQDWSETIDWIKDKTNAAGLTLRLVMGDAPHDRKPMTWAEGNAVLAGHKRILGPLARLGGGDGGNNSLRRFYVQVTWPAWPCDPRADGAPVDEASKARTVLYEVHFD